MDRTPIPFLRVRVMANLSFRMHDAQIALISGDPDVTVGLLTSPPSADGSNINEPNVAYGYVRQPIAFSPATRENGVSSVLRSNVSSVFGPAKVSNWPTVTHLAIFDGQGRLLAYSPLATSRTAPIGDTISFGSTAVQLRFN